MANNGFGRKFKVSNKACKKREKISFTFWKKNQLHPQFLANLIMLIITVYMHSATFLYYLWGISFYTMTYVLIYVWKDLDDYLRWLYSPSYFVKILKVQYFIMLQSVQNSVQQYCQLYVFFMYNSIVIYLITFLALAPTDPKFWSAVWFS